MAIHFMLYQYTVGANINFPFRSRSTNVETLGLLSYWFSSVFTQRSYVRCRPSVASFIDSARTVISHQ